MLGFVVYWHFFADYFAKYYFLQYRNAGIFYEALTPLILKQPVKKVQPLEMTVEAEFTPRGGLTTKVVSSYKK